MSGFLKFGFKFSSLLIIVIDFFKQFFLQVWAIAKDGSVFLRHGITDVAPTGQIWIQAHPPGSGIGSGLKSVTGGDQSLWALDHNGKVWYRQEITPVFPEGTSWTSVANMSSSPNAFTGGQFDFFREINFMKKFS